METKIGNVRWKILSLIFFATTVNYLDRAVISLLKPYLAAAFEWTPVQEAANYANIEIAFKLSYAIGMMFVGGIVDKLGTKRGYFWATCLWSFAAISHALATGTWGFAIARIFLGVTEAGNFPAAIKATAEWFPKKERALATGIFNSGANIGAIVAPLSVPFIADSLGWQWAFIITGAIGFIWLVLWSVYYTKPSDHPSLSKEEYEYIHGDTDSDIDKANEDSVAEVSWGKMFSFRQTWAFAIGKLLTDPIWWFYLFWLPDFLKKQYHLSGTEIAFPTALVYIISSFGSVGGGWLPMKLVNSGWTVFNARRTSMLVYAFLVMPIVSVQYLGAINMWYAVMVIGLAAAAHQAWSANIFTTVSDMFPKKTTGFVTGIGGMFGGLGGILLSMLVQKRMFVYYESIGDIQTGYYIMFFICGLSYLSAWLIMKALVPKFKQVEL